MVKIGRFNICFSLTSLNRFSAAPQEGHIKRPVKIFGYFQNAAGKRKSIVISPYDIRDISVKGSNTTDWMKNYHGVTEDIYEVLTNPQVKPLSTKIYFDSDHAHDKVTRISVSGVMCFVGSTPIRLSGNMQVEIDTSS